MPKSKEHLPNSEHHEQEFERALLAEYFQNHNSIETVYRNHHYDLPLSICSFRRLIDRYDIVRSAGRPETNLSEALFILKMVLYYKISLEEVFRDILPNTVKTSITTMYRILRDIRQGTANKVGEALIVTPEGNPDLILLANDFSLKNSNLGHPGDLSLPMGYSQKGESPALSIKRVMQQEMFTSEVLTKNFPQKLIPKNPPALFYVNIADIRVAVHHLVVPPDLSFSSFKLSGYRYEDVHELANLNPHHEHLRPGIVDIATHYQNHDYGQENSPIPHHNSYLNQALLAAYLPS